MAERAAKDVLPTPRAPHPPPESARRPLGKRAHLPCSTQPVAQDLVRPLRVVVHRVEQRLTVARPGRRFHLLDALGKQLTGSEILDLERVVSEACLIEREREIAPVRRYLVEPEAEKRPALCKRIHVEQNQLGVRLAGSRRQ